MTFSRWNHLLFIARAVILVQLLVTSAVAFGISAKVESDLVEGYIRINPAIPEVRSNSVITGRSTCFGICFGGFTSQPEARKEGEKNTYMFLTGNPDDLTFSLLSFSCRGERLVQFRHINQKIVVFDGLYSVHGQLASGNEIVAGVLDAALPGLVQTIPESYMSRRPYHIHYLCSDKFRQEFKPHSLLNLARGFGPHFLAKYKDGWIEIVWDTSKWRDRVDQKIAKTLKETRAKMAKYDVHLPPVIDPFPQTTNPRFLHLFDDIDEPSYESNSPSGLPDDWLQ